MSKDIQIINCHTHTFTIKAVPNDAHRFFTVRLARNRITRLLLKGVLWLLPFKRLNRLHALVKIGSRGTQQEVFDELAGSYPVDARFIVLSMDFEYMSAGRSPQSYTDQLDELAEVRDRYPRNIIPFIAVDPRREGILELVKHYVKGRGFGGIKLYPPLGFFPQDQSMDNIYEYAEKNSIPIITHCARGGIYYKGEITQEMRTDPHSSIVYAHGRSSSVSDNWSHPRNYETVLKKYPDLKICLAHYGGENEWEDYLGHYWPHRNIQGSWLLYINNMIREYKNLYVDISYTAHNKKFWPLIKALLNTEVIKDRILYGSDYYLVSREANEKKFAIELRSFVGEMEFRRMAEANPGSFLGLGKAIELPDMQIA